MAWIRIGATWLEIELQSPSIGIFNARLLVEVNEDAYTTADDIRVSTQFAYAEVKSPFAANDIRVSAEFAYAEILREIPDDIRVSTQFAYAEILREIPDDIRVSTEFAYSEQILDNDIYVSKVIAYLETQGEGESVSQFGVYVEYLGQGLSVTKIIALAELEYIEQEETVAVYERKNAGMRAIHTLLPEEKTGWALDPQHSFWSVILPEAGVNLWPNPGFHDPTGNDNLVYNGWTSDDIASGFPYGVRGPNFIKTVPNPANVEGFITSDDGHDLTAGYWTWSFWLWAWIGQEFFFRIRDNTDTNTIAYKYVKIEEAGWHRHSITWIETGAVTRKLQIRMLTAGVPTDLYICTDGWQLENKPYATTLIDGDMIAPNDSPADRSFYWNGNPMLSSSTREITAEGHGRIVSFSEDFQFFTTGIMGLGMNELELILNKAGTSGIEIYSGSYDKPRDFTIVGRVFGTNFRILMENRERLIEILRNNRAGRRPQIRLRYQATDSKGEPYGMYLDILCAYRDGMKGNITNDYTESIPLSFHAADPFLFEDIETAIPLTLPTPWDCMGLAYRDTQGTWQGLGAGNAVTTGQIGKDVCIGEDGKIYFVGDFTKIGITSINYAGYWDGSSWNQVDNGGVGFDDVVRRVKRHNHYVNRILFGGDFLNFDGGAASQLSYWNPETGTLTGVIGFASGGVYDFISGPYNTYYVAGSFTHAGTGATNLVKIDSSGAAVDVAGGGLNGTVNRIYLHDGWLYCSGSFTTSGDTTVSGLDKLCRIKVAGAGAGSPAYMEFFGFWDPATANITIGDMVVDRHGKVYIQWDNSTYPSTGGFSVWDGSSWSHISYVTLTAGTAYPCRFGKDSNGDILLGNPQRVPTLPTEYGYSMPRRIVNGQFYPIDLLPDIDFVSSGGSAPWQWWASDATEDGQMVFGYGDMGYAGTNAGGVVTEVQYGGNANVRPYIGINGPISIHHIANLDTGGEIWFKSDMQFGLVSNSLYNGSFVVGVNERVYIYFDNGRIRMWSNRFGDVSRWLVPEFSEFGKFYLQPGTNRISLLAFSETPSLGQVWIGYHNRYLSIESAAVT